jgi:hypothetical protein
MLRHEWADSEQIRQCIIIFWMNIEKSMFILSLARYNEHVQHKD